MIAKRQAGAGRFGPLPSLGYLPGVRLAYHMVSSPLGLLFLARTARGLRYLQFMDRKSLKRTIASHAPQQPDAKWEPSLLELKGVVEQLEAYFQGGLTEFETPLDAIGSEFQQRTWRALREIPYGETRTYGQIAAALGQPKASRAVGLANNQNPIAIIVPCHRVIGANGSLTGYGGGRHRKRWLLEHEARQHARIGAPLDLFVPSERAAPRRGRG